MSSSTLSAAHPRTWPPFPKEYSVDIQKLKKGLWDQRSEKD